MQARKQIVKMKAHTWRATWGGKHYAYRVRMPRVTKTGLYDAHYVTSDDVVWGVFAYILEGGK